ncbi:MAG: HupE/UreJ family protein [Burkholderiales bacterium]
MIRGLVLLVLLLHLPQQALAHKPSDSYLVLQAEGPNVAGQWDIALRDLEHAIGLDADGDGAITWGELKARHAAIAAYALGRLKLRTESRDCEIKVTDHLVDNHTDGAYAVLRFDAACSGPESRALEIEYRLFFDLDPTHRGLLRWQSGKLTMTGVLSPDRPVLRVQGEEASRLAQFFAYGREGVWHIWIGIDHMLFLISLLLPAVLVASGRDWAPVGRLAAAIWDVLKVVTSFTLAHSITLSLAALSVISLPTRLTETAIALSVFLAALNNIWPVVYGRRWIVAFGFGLIHGFGFASVLAELGLPRDTLLTALVGFNLGVEAGQLVVVAAFLPFAYSMRRTVLYRRVILLGGSATIAAVAAAWMAERWFDLKLFTG